MSFMTGFRRGSAIAFVASALGEVFAFLSFCFVMDARIVLTFCLMSIII
jgi:hypothetical protein